LGRLDGLRGKDEQFYTQQGDVVVNKLTDDEIKRIKEEANADADDVLKLLAQHHPILMMILKVLRGTTTGVAIALLALIFCGKVGLSAVGIATALATLGLGGGMVVGILVLSLPITFFTLRGYSSAKKSNNLERIAAINKAIIKLSDIKSRLATSIPSISFPSTKGMFPAWCWVFSYGARPLPAGELYFPNNIKHRSKP
jgi:hypothetical protein